MRKLEKYKNIIINKYVNDKKSSSELSQEFKCSRQGILAFLRKNNIPIRNALESRKIRAQNERDQYKAIKNQKCTSCNIVYLLNEDHFYLRSSKTKYHRECKECFSKRNKEYKTTHKEELKTKRDQNKENKSIYNKKYRSENKKKISKIQKEYKAKNRKQVNKRKREYNKKQYHNNISFKLRTLVSKSIRQELKKQALSKNNKSSLNYLPYSIQELKKHLESQFENWMTWNNHGQYSSSTWNDNDPSTWTWQIDHIIPHSKFNYKSMQDPLFLECWSLKNLRPLSSKENLMDGCTRKRHF